MFKENSIKVEKFFKQISKGRTLTDNLYQSESCSDCSEFTDKRNPPL